MFRLTPLVMAILLVAYRNAFSIDRGGGWALESEAFYLLVALSVFFLGSGRYAVRADRAR